LLENTSCRPLGFLIEYGQRSNEASSYRRLFPKFIFLNFCALEMQMMY
jgi:hypothetical protein